MTSPAKRRQAVEHVQDVFPISEHRACRVIGIPRSSQRYQPHAADGDTPLTQRIVHFATRYGRYGYRRITALLRHEADAVIVFASDRLTRKLAHLLILRDEWQRAGIELHFVRRGKSEDTPENRMMENIEGVFNEYWREKIIEASRRGSCAKAKSGLVVGCGTAPYGYRFSEGRFVVFMEEAGIIRMIFNWYVNGDEDGNGPLSMYEIARRLSKMRIPSPGQKQPRGKPRVRALGIWDPVTVLNILRNETYAGVWHYGKRIGGDGRGGSRPASEQIAVTVPSIIDRGLWEAAKRQRKRNKQMSKRNCKRQYLLRGMTMCGCGHKMSGANGRYMCNQYFHRFKDLEKQRCSEKAVNGGKLDAMVWDYILTVITDPEHFERALRTAQRAEKDALEPKRKRLKLVDHLLAKCKREADLLAQGIARLGTGVVGHALEEQVHSVEENYAALLQEKTELQVALDDKRITDEDITAAMQFRHDLAVGIINPTFEDKRRILELLQVKVTVKDGKSQLVCLVPNKGNHNCIEHSQKHIVNS